MILAQSDPFTTADAITLGIASIGAFTGIAALGITVSQFWLSGPRLRVQIKCAHIGAFSILTGGESWDSADARTLAAHPVPAVSIHVANRGRMATTIETWGIDVGSRMIYRQLNLPHNPELPVKLEAGASATFLAELAEVVAGNRAAINTLGGHPGKVYGEVSRGDGKTVRSKRPLRIPTD